MDILQPIYCIQLFCNLPFVFTSALILTAIHFTRCWEEPSEILPHTQMIVSHSDCRFLHIQYLKFLFLQIPNDTSWICCTLLWCSRSPVETIWALWHGAGSSQKTGALCDVWGQHQCTGMLQCLSNAHPKDAKKKHPLHHYITCLNCWCKAGWIHAFMLFTSNYNSSIWMLLLRLRLTKPAIIFPACYSCILLSLSLL